MVEMQAACLLKSRLTLNPWRITVTPSAAGGSVAELVHPGEKRILVAGEPHAEGAAAQICRRGDAGLPAAGQHHARSLEDLRDVDERHAFLARPQGRGH